MTGALAPVQMALLTAITQSANQTIGDGSAPPPDPPSAAGAVEHMCIQDRGSRAPVEANVLVFVRKDRLLIHTCAFNHSNGAFMGCETVHFLPVIFTDACPCQSFVWLRLISPSLLFP